MKTSEYLKIVKLITVAVNERAGCSDPSPKFDAKLDKLLKEYLDQDSDLPSYELVRLVAY